MSNWIAFGIVLVIFIGTGVWAWWDDRRDTDGW